MLATLRSSEDSLPLYTQADPRPAPSAPPARQLVDHSYRLRNKQGHAWLTLKCASKARSASDLPCFVEGDPVNGSVELSLMEETTVKCVIVSVVGELIAEANERFPFLELSQEVWTAKDLSNTSNAPSSSSSKVKLSGTHSWPFSFSVPKTVDLPVDGARQAFRLPPSFLSRNTKCTILYRLEVTVEHGRFQPNHQLGTTFGYMPVIAPGPFSVARTLAYQERVPLLELDADPDGWLTLSTVAISGTIFSTRPIELRCTLSLAKPLSYTRGTVIPLLLTLECTDTQALDVLAAPTSPQIRLRRTLTIGYSIGGKSSNGGKVRMSDIKKGNFIPSTGVLDHLQFATWWPSPYSGSESGATRRTLQGEIHLPQGLHPSARLGRYKLSYDVLLYTPTAVAFSQTNAKKDPLQTVEVEIATAYAPGPRPLKYSPPQYGDLANAIEEPRTANQVLMGFL